MAVTVVDLDAAMVAGLAKAQEWEAQFQAQFYGPQLMAQAVQMFLSLTPEQQDQLQAADPEAFDELKAQVDEVRKRAGGKHGNPQVPAQDPDRRGAEAQAAQSASPVPQFQPPAA